MKPLHLLFAVASVLLMPVTASAQQGTPIQPGAEVQGDLAAGDQLLQEDGSYYDVYLLEITEGTEYTITLTSDDFDPFLLIFDTDENLLYLNDDAEDMGENSQIRFTAETTTTVQIYTNSVFAEETGAYVLKVESP